MIKIYRKGASIHDALMYAVLVNFLIILTWIVIFKVNRSWIPELARYMRSLSISQRLGKNAIPCYSLFMQIKNGGFSLKSDHFLNILAFIPFGILMPFFLKKKKAAIAVLISFGSSLFFELFQLFSGIGSYDSTDLITNTLGGFIGFLLYRYGFSKIKDNVVNIISSAVNVIATPFSLYALFNTIIHIDYYL